MIEGVRESWNKIFEEKEKMMQKFREEFGHEPKDDNGKLDRVLDTMVGPDTLDHDWIEKHQGGIAPEGRPRRGRPLGSKNKPKPELNRPSLIGHIPQDDLILLPRRG